VGDCARQTYQAVEDLLIGVIEQAVAEGGLPATTEPRALGRLPLAIQQGSEFLDKTGMEPAALRQIGRAAVNALLR
jgi:TetR/AcrR family transcriptional repressor of nem operon